MNFPEKSLVALFALAASACQRANTVAVINASGERIVVQIMQLAQDDSSRLWSDVLWQDSVEVGQSACWSIPTHARGARVNLVIGFTRRLPDLREDVPAVDSLELLRSITAQVHLPSLLAGSEKWTSAFIVDETKIARANIEDADAERRNESSAVTRADSLLQEMYMLRPGAPRREASVSIRSERGCP